MLDIRKMRAHDSRGIANIFVDLALAAERRLTILPLVKYVYLAHGWTLGYTGKPLIRHQVQAWKYGPVIPEVYLAFAPRRVITEKARPHDPEFGAGPYYKADPTPEQGAIIRKVYEAYSDMGAFALSKLTHREGTPWANHNTENYAPIPDAQIKEHYQELVGG